MRHQISDHFMGMLPLLRVQKMQVLMEIRVTLANPAVKAKVKDRIIAAFEHVLNYPL